MTNKNSLPLVTVAVPCYNHEKYVEDTIKSIVNQTYKNIELIVIDDGSKDSSGDIIQKLSDEFGFQFTSRENKGLLETLDELLKKATGKYFCVCASDDKFFLDKVEKQVTALESNPSYALCFGKMVGIDESSKVILDKYKTKYNESGNIFEKLLLSNFITTPTVMMVKDILIEVEGYDPSFRIEDYPLWLKISKEYKILYLDESLVYYRRHEGNMSKNFAFMLEETEKILIDWHGKCDDKIYYTAINKHNLDSFVQSVKANKKDLAKKYMLKSFLASWYRIKFIKGVLRYFKKF